jgi:alpha-mannosidase
VADIGVHHFTYALYPHVGDYRAGGVHAEATKLNVPLVVRPTALPPQDVTFISCEASNVTIEAVKRSEDGGRLIVRLVERENKRTHAKLTLKYAIQAVVNCDLMENGAEPVAHDAHTVSVMLKPRDIVTLAIRV